MKNLLLNLHSTGVMIRKQPTSSSFIIMWPFWLRLTCPLRSHRPMKRYRGSPSDVEPKRAEIEAESRVLASDVVLLIRRKVSSDLTGIYIRKVNSESRVFAYV